MNLSWKSTLNVLVVITFFRTLPIEKEAFGSPSTTVANFTIYIGEGIIWIQNPSQYVVAHIFLHIEDLENDWILAWLEKKIDARDR